MIDQLKSHILQFSKPNEDELNEFLNAVDLKHIKNKNYLLRKGQYCKFHYFILQGCFRAFFINEKGVEKIINFGIENWWMTDFDSFINGSKTDLNIQAIEDSIVLRISKSKLDDILKKSIEINRYFRVILEKVRIADQRRIHYMFSLSGKEMYDVFCEANPGFIQRVPQYMLASYLGFTPEFLSKIRKQK